MPEEKINMSVDRNTLNHSTSHLMAEAIMHLYPEAKLGFGPAIEDGFYYDIDLGDKTLSDEDLPIIEKEMKKCAKADKRIYRKRNAQNCC